MNFMNIVKSTAGKVTFFTKQHSPEILLVAGIGGVIAGTALACVASTTKVSDILDEHKGEMEEIKEELTERVEAGEVSEDDKLPKDIQLQMVSRYKHTAEEMVKAYAPAAIVGGLGIACILTSYGIMRKRYLASLAAYTALDTAFKEYRQRVVEDQGAAKDREYRYGIKKVQEQKVVGKNKKGEDIVETVEVERADQPSMYAKLFDANSSSWAGDPEVNRMTIQMVEKWAQDMLDLRGYVFLNEVYRELDIPETEAGQIVGWKKGVTDDYVDFGINNTTTPAVFNFVNGKLESILLDFNVEPIFDYHRPSGKDVVEHAA
jgi:hypothetical protein